jgi:hypothetical protein
MRAILKYYGEVFGTGLVAVFPLILLRVDQDGLDGIMFHQHKNHIYRKHISYILGDNT